MATFINNYKLQVHTKEGVQDIEAERYIIATGSEPIALPFAPFDGEWILNSTHALEQPYLPKSILIVGGGVIGCEFASIYSRLGCEVTIVEMADSILPGRRGYCGHTGKAATVRWSHTAYGCCCTTTGQS